MLLGRNLILATKPFAKEIRARSWLLTLSTLAFLIVTLTGALILPGIPLKFLSGTIAGLLLVRMFIIYHDHQHHNILTHSVAADIIMTIFGVYMLAPSSIWKRSHDHHHNHNSKLFSASIGSFPIVTKKKFLEMKPVERFVYLAIRHPVTIFFGYLFMFMIGMSVRSFVSNPRKHYDSLIALILHFAVAIWLFVGFGWQAWFFMFCLPFLVSHGMGSYLFYAQHNFPDVKFYENKDWVYEKAAMESSSYMKMNPVMAWFTGNIGYHHIHHLNSKIPFYRLPEAMKHLSELQNCKTTSLSPRSLHACLRLKVWDQETDRMIGVRGLK